VTPRIAPIDPPYAPAVAAQLEAMTPPQTAPIALFRTFVHNFDMTEAMTGWGRYELGRRLSVSMRDREIVIDRVCARCGCEYEWGVHVAYFAGRVGLTDRQVASLTLGGPDDPCWTDERERALIAAPGRTLRRAPVARSVAAVRLVPRHQLRRPRHSRRPRTRGAALRGRC
jgi:Carboxymuconolactone decarboxylase family